VWRTRDEGGHWENVTPQALTPWSKVGIIEASHFDAESAYAAVDRHRLDDARPYVYRTHDGGRSWTLAARGIPQGSFVNVVREDPVRAGLLYAGTEKGVYVSLDDGDHWQPLQLDLPVSSVRDIDVHGNDLVIATHGRAFWILDDVTPLRQIDEGVAQASAWLFAPAPAVRLRPSPFAGTPLPKDEPMAANPPEGAFIDYVVKDAQAGPLTLSILDAQGGLVRRYSSEDRLPAADLGKLRVAPGWITAPAGLSTTPGMHRFVWPLRYPAPPALAERGAEGSVTEGVWAPPGIYTVELSVGAHRQSQPLTIAADPRIGLSAEAYARQFALARRIEEARARVAAAVTEAESLHKTRPGDARLLALTGPQFGEAPAGRPPDGLSSLRALADALTRLSDAVDGAEAAPTPDAEAGFGTLQPAVEATLSAWSALKARAR
jgi:hypothetical protein